jgi:tRNA-specific 2-thiouridylase
VARKFGLSVADKDDSQDICFVPQGRYTDIIEKLMPNAGDAGEIVDLEGRVLGRHNGIIHFTIGQRKGLGVAAGYPLYVLQLDAATRRVVVGPRDALRTRRISLRDVNWIGDGTIEEALDGGRREVFVKVRSTRPPQPAWLMPGGAGVVVELIDGEDGVAPGQACVFYDAPEGQARVLGGGFIKSTLSMTASHAVQKEPLEARAS